MSSYVDRKAVLRAFKELRKNNILAKANHLCCQSCGSSDLCERINTDEVREWKGYVFWHRQVEAGAFPGGAKTCEFKNKYKFSSTRNMNLNLYYSGTKDIYESKSQGLTAEEVGHALFYALKDEGLNVLWDGNSANTVIVIPDGFDAKQEMGLGLLFSFLNPDSSLIPSDLRELIRTSRTEWLEFSEKRNKEWEEENSLKLEESSKS